MRPSWITLACVLAAWAGLFPVSASAKDEETCEARFSDGYEQAVVDRRALGGDPNALSTRAVCSWPLDEDGAALRKSVSRTQIIDAFFWTALAYCSASNSEEQETADELAKKNLVARASSRGRDGRLQARFQGAREALSLLGDSAQDDAERTYMQNLAALGLAGLVQLGQTSACAIKVNRATLAGIWQAAAQKWDDQNRGGKTNQFRAKANSFTATLTDTERTQAQFIKQSLLIQSQAPAELAQLAAIAHIDDLQMRDVQWMLYMLGLYKGAMNGEYDGKIATAVGNAERKYLRQSEAKSDRWLTNKEARDLFCEAALNPGPTRPLALSYLGYMYANGIGFPQDLLKSRAILQVAVPALADVLGAARATLDKAVLTAAQTTAQVLLRDVNEQIDQSRLANQNIAPFSFEASFLCPAVRNAGAQEKAEMSVPDLPARGFSDMSAQGLGSLGFQEMTCSGRLDEAGRCMSGWRAAR